MYAGSAPMCTFKDMKVNRTKLVLRVVCIVQLLASKQKNEITKYKY